MSRLYEMDQLRAMNAALLKAVQNMTLLQEKQCAVMARGLAMIAYTAPPDDLYFEHFDTPRMCEFNDFILLGYRRPAGELPANAGLPDITPAGPKVVSKRPDPAVVQRENVSAPKGNAKV